ncbi:urea carboxylase-associated family protein [Flavobacterium sp. J372]|uniref:urea carboxylase-associated family protein n=1 Tax=Flavobacterium sp. J372 TaxID=2898436 RepID=UPI002151E1CC|nr:urea carboxylase-associated family protein [Flavobacterium sp. J372]MCR5861725.1 urea carboxylase-associated family protein [Flavobacterium sp. J372]
MHIINPRSGTSFILKKGQRLKVTDIKGEQVSDLLCFNLHDKKEYLSSGRTIDYAETIFLTTGHPFYSNRSNIMFRIVEDTVGRHDFLLTPCSKDTFRIIYGHENPHKGCFGNLCEALAEYGIEPDDIPITFNVFMHVAVDGATGKVDVLPPKSNAGDYIIIEAVMDLIVGLTACSAEMSNNGSFKPIGYEVMQ